MRVMTQDVIVVVVFLLIFRAMKMNSILLALQIVGVRIVVVCRVYNDFKA